MKKDLFRNLKLSDAKGFLDMVEVVQLMRMS